MAKEIKVLKCPQCGSTAKTEIKPDFYRCNNCQAEYFLDDNDVTINYNHNYNHNQNTPLNNDNSKKVIKVIGLVIGVFFALTILINIVSAIFSSKSGTPSASVYSTSSSSEEKKGFYASRYNSSLFINSSKSEPVAIVVEDRRYNAKSDEQKNGLYIAFYDPASKELIGEQKLSGEHMSSSEVKMRTFSDGNLYVLSGKSTLYVVDKTSMKLIDAGKKFFAAKEELQVGVATIEFVYEDNGDGLILLTNDGKKLYYYPLIQKLYSEDNYYNARIGFKNLLPDAKEKTINVFTNKSTDYPDEKLQLIKIKYKDNGAGPKDVVDNLSWGKDYGGSGIFTDRDPYRKVLFDDYAKQRGRVIEWKDLTPGRLYFSPSVIFDDGSTLLISFKPDANPNSNQKLQQLNTSTGAVEWTSDDPKGSAVAHVVKYKGGFIGITGDEEIITFDAKGKVLSTYKIE